MAVIWILYLKWTTFLFPWGLCSNLFFCYKQDTRLSENQIADPGKGGLPRFVLIARLAQVDMLNGSEVNARCCTPTFVAF